MLPKLAVIGLNHGYALARAARAANSFELVGLCARDPQKHKPESEQLDVPLFSDLDLMLREARPDAVAIATPTNLLTSIASQCLERDIAVLVEKPAAIDVAEAHTLQAVARRTSAPLLVGYYRRLARQVTTLKGLLESGVIGEVAGINCTLMVKKQSGYFTGWKVCKNTGGGCLMINAIHDIDTLQYLLGPIESVMAMQSNCTFPGDVEHLIAFSMRFVRGALGVATLSDYTPSPYSYDNTVAARTKFPQYPADCFHFFGTNGSIAFPSFTRYAPMSPDSGWADRLASAAVCDSNHSYDDPLIREIEHFRDIVRGGCAPVATIEDAIQNLAVVEAIRLSLQGSATKVNLPR